MSLRKVEQYIDILLYLHSNDNITMNSVVNQFKMKYSTVRTIFKRWLADNYILKVRIKDIKAGDDQYYYEITQAGVDYLKQLESKLKKISNK